MNKPTTMSHKEWLIKKLSIKIVVSEKIIDAIVNHQFDEANLALKVKNSIEFSGFGKFVFNMNKANKKMAKLQSHKLTYEGMFTGEPVNDAKTQKKLDTVLNSINSIKDKLK
jgi:nucleoid DNA-binding protein